MLPADLRQVGIRSGGLRALRVLEVCPMLPADAFGPMVGLVSRSVGYKQLARLRAQGLAEVRNEDLGFLLGDRRRGLWSITDLGRRALHGAHEDEHPDPLAPRTTQRRQRLNRQLPLRVACYWLLSCFVVEGREQGEVLEVQGWEFPWVAEFQLVKMRRVCG